jgi:two-component system phosphate regulon sensor histidine kinase PhoR
MRSKTSFRTRLIVSFSLLMVLTLGLMLLYSRNTVSDEILLQKRRQAISSLDLVDWLMRQEALQKREDLQRWLAEIGARMDLRVTYMADGGRVIADSHIPVEEIANLENFAGRPEIVAARSHSVGIIVRYSDTLRADMLYAAKVVTASGNMPPGVLRVALPAALLMQHVGRMDRIWLLLSGCALLVTALIGYRLTSPLQRSIRTIIRAAEAIGGANFKQRIRFDPGQEFSLLAQSINQMAERLTAHIHTITDQKQQLEAILNGMQEGVMLLDSRGRIHTVNPALRAIVPSNAQIVGRRPLELFMDPELQDCCERVIAGTAGDSRTPVRIHMAIDRERMFEVTIVRVHDRDKGVGAIIVFHDISELKRLERVRQDFVANVSHELRTPLTSIKGYAETLLAEARRDPEAVHSFLQVILKNADHMVKMVNDLLALAKLEASRVGAHCAAVNAAEALIAAWKACAPLAEEKGVHLENALPEAGVSVQANQDQLQQVFRNLLENSIRYSPGGERVTVSCIEEGNRVTFMVTDRGPGIPKADQQRIFERFYRVERHRVSDSGSTGLGLAICRNIIRNHGGRIWVESPGREGTAGTTVCFTLAPAGKEDAQRGEATPP